MLIYIISDAWYCESDSAQCKWTEHALIQGYSKGVCLLGFTTYKGVGSLLVIGCVLLFTIGRSGSAEKKFG